MSSVELTVIVQDESNVRAKGLGDAEASCRIEHDPLRRDTIKIFEDWLNLSKISKRRELEVLGTYLYRLLFNGEVETFFKKALDAVPMGERLRIQLSFQEKAAELASLPWEYLYYPDTETSPGFFISTYSELVLSRYMPPPGGSQPLAPGESPLCILIVVSKPEDKDLGPVAAEPVIEAIEELPDIEIHRLDKPTVDNFLEKLKTKPHVLHFIGHGRFNKAERKGEIALLKPDEQSVEWVSDRMFTEYFVQMRAKPRLAVLHLCEGATADFEANFAGLAQQLIRAGIPAVVAMQYPISNKAACAFSQAFYRELANGEPIDHAVQTGRRRITMDDPKAYDTRVFGTPVLYMHSRDGIIQPRRKTETKPESPDKPVPQATAPGKSETKQASGAESRQPRPIADDSFDRKTPEAEVSKVQHPLTPIFPEAEGSKVLHPLTPIFPEAEDSNFQQRLISILIEAQLKVNQMDLADAQKQAMREKFSSLRKELRGKPPIECLIILSTISDFETDASLKEIWRVMAEKMK